MASYATPSELRAEINLESTSDDDQLQRILDAATRKFNRLCNRPDGFIADAVVSAKYYSGGGLPFIRINECVEITAVAVKDSPSDDSYTAWTTPSSELAGDGDWIPFSGDPERPEFNRTPYTGLMIDPNGDYSTFTSGSYTHKGGFRPTTTVSRGVPTVRVTARWGYANTVPDDIKEACIMQAARWYKELQGGMTDTLASVEVGQLLYKMELHPDIAGILKAGRYVVPATGRL